jgi:hypothetical protein
MPPHLRDGDRVLPFTPEHSGGEEDVEGALLELPPLTSENEEKYSGGETRTHNLAGAQDEDSEQHQLE